MTDVIMQISDFVDMKYPNYSTEELQLTIIKELYDIAVSFEMIIQPQIQKQAHILILFKEL